MDVLETSQEDWDRYYLGMARQASTKSKDPSTKVGAIIVRPDKTLVSTGYNGFPRRMPDRLDWLNDRSMKYPHTIHGEINALLMARENVEGCTLYTWPFAPCGGSETNYGCAIIMAQAGIDRVVSIEASVDLKSRWEDSHRRAEVIYEVCGMDFIEYPFDFLD